MINRIVFTRRMLSNILCVMALCLPIFRYYDLLSTGVGIETIMTLSMLFICIVLLVLSNQGRRTIYTETRRSQLWFGAMILWLLIITCAYEIFTEINISNPLAEHSIMSLIMIVIRSLVIGYLLGGNFDFRDVFKVYTAIVFFIIAIYLLQWGLLLSGKMVSFKMPLPYNGAYTYLNGMTYFGMQNDPTSLFSERAHLSEFLVPYVAVCLFGKKLKKRRPILQAVIVTIVIMTTVSGTGMIVVLIEWLLFFAGLGQKKSKYRFVYLALGILAICAVYLILIRIPEVNNMFNKLFVDNTGDDYNSTKADYRIYRGFDLFTKLPLYGQIFGIGYNHMQLFATVHNIVSEYDNENLAYEFLSTIFQIAIYSGYIGIVCGVKHIYHLFKSNSPLSKALIIIMLAMWCSSAMFLTNSHIVMTMLIISAIYYENKPSEENA